ncbi:type IV pilus biogenesis/stability protein PilW [Alkalilimnicola ehrlichii]|uniref:type IV pilus biogenesis/stability protein PilW n=1 Tax=Alkalilimnicola ehrlichii TaxID=351052 RepID=UPI003BA0C7AB
MSIPPPFRPALILFLAVAVVGCGTMGQSGSGDRDRAAEVNTQLGLGYLQEGEYEEAHRRLERALDIDRRYAPAHAAMALLQEQLGQPEEAGRHYRRAVRLDGENASTRNNYGRFLCKQGDLDRALDQFEAALGNPLYPNPHIPLANAGVCLMREGQHERAEDYFLRSLRENARFAPALLRMAQLRFQAGDHEGAEEYLNRYRAEAQHTPASLWLGVQLARALGDADAEASYGLSLRNRFPDSREARLYRESR